MTNTKQDFNEQITALGQNLEKAAVSIRQAVAALEGVRMRREDMARESGACTFTAEVHAWEYDRGGNTRRTCSRCGMRQRLPDLCKGLSIPHTLVWVDE